MSQKNNDRKLSLMHTIDIDQLATASGGFRGGNPAWAAARAANLYAQTNYWNNANAYLPLYAAAASGAVAPRPATTVIYT